MAAAYLPVVRRALFFFVLLIVPPCSAFLCLVAILTVLPSQIAGVLGCRNRADNMVLCLIHLRELLNMILRVFFSVGCYS